MENQFFPYQINPKRLTHEELSWVGEHFVDESGNTVVLKAKTIDEIGESLEQMRKDGFTSLHIPISWSLAQDGDPSHFNEEYLSIIDNIIDEAKKAHIYTFLDFDLDMPNFAYDAVGFDLTHIDHHKPYVDQTMRALFLEGESLVARVQIDGFFSDIYLQKKYAKFLNTVAARQKGRKHVLGFHLPNNLDMGLLSFKNLKKPLFDDMTKADGFGSHIRAWKDDTPCIWRDYNVWTVNKKGKPKLLTKDHFTISKKRKKYLLDRFYTTAKRGLISAKTDKLISTLGVTHRFDKAWPYAQTLCGKNNQMRFSPREGKFKLTFKRDEKCDNKIAIFLPHNIYKHGFNVTFTSGKCNFDKDSSTLYYHPGLSKKHKLVIVPKTPKDPKGLNGSALS